MCKRSVEDQGFDSLHMGKKHHTVQSSNLFRIRYIALDAELLLQMMRKRHEACMHSALKYNLVA